MFKIVLEQNKENKVRHPTGQIQKVEARVFVCADEGHEIMFAFYLPKVQVLFRHALGFRQITPSCLPTLSKAAKTLSNCSSEWVAM